MKVAELVLAFALCLRLGGFFFYRHLEIGRQIEMVAVIFLLLSILWFLAHKKFYKTLLAVIFASGSLVSVIYLHTLSALLLTWGLILCIALVVFIKVTWSMRALLLIFFLFPKVGGFFNPIYAIDAKEGFSHFSLGNNFIFSNASNYELMAISYANPLNLIDIVNNDSKLILIGKIDLIYNGENVICGYFQPFSLAENKEITNGKKGYFYINKQSREVFYNQPVKELAKLCNEDNKP